MNEVMQHSNQTAAIEVTDAAKRRFLTCLAEQVDGKGIRLSVKKTGCSGLAYVIDYVSESADDDIIVPALNEYFICIDKRSYPFIKGLQIDYVKQGLNQKFVFINPNQTGQCGCGESFTVD